MILPNQKDAIHKAWMYRILTSICDNQELADAIYFKGGTCAAMRGLLNRFSIDLDFDYVGKLSELAKTRKMLEQVFIQLGLEIKDKSAKVPQYFLKYPTAKDGERNTIKIDITMPCPKSNKYELVRLSDIDRIIHCQTVETMFANKLVALINRYEKNNSIAGRDMYDIHYFFINNFKYDKEVIIERRGNKDLKKFFTELINFIENNITDTIISQDINMLLSYQEFKKIRKILKQEVLMFLRDEIERLK
ncbi:MAG: nucleotidyl transferase AbiEii/AbiGii toxin family protein [Patescibacteria group bacterium]